MFTINYWIKIYENSNTKKSSKQKWNNSSKEESKKNIKDDNFIDILVVHEERNHGSWNESFDSTKTWGCHRWVLWCRSGMEIRYTDFGRG